MIERRQQEASHCIYERRGRQRRAARRFAAEISVTLDYGGQKTTVKCIDLSFGGLRVRGNLPLEAGTRLVLRMSFNQNMSFMCFAGLVLATSRSKQEDDLVPSYETSLRFTHIGVVEEKVLEACLTELGVMPKSDLSPGTTNLLRNSVQILLTDKPQAVNQLGRRRVMITGMGVISPIGIGREEFFNGLREGRSGIDKVTRFDVSDLPSQLAAEVNGFEPLSYISPRKARQMDRCTQMAVAAAILGITDASIELDRVEREKVGAFIGTAIGGLRWAFEQEAARQIGGYKNVDPRSMIAIYPNAVSGQVSVELGLKGRTDTISSGCASAGTAFGVAAELIHSGELDMALVGGTEDPIEPSIFGTMCAAGALSTINERPVRTPRPFDAERDGPVLGEGAGVLIFEELEHALRRGAKIYGEFKGFGSTTDAFSLSRTDPNGTQASRAVRMALEDAELTPDDIDFINAYGIATPSCDWAEARVIRDVFGERASRIPVSAIQSMTGYPWAAIGAFQLMASCLAISQGLVAPTINYSVPDPNCKLNIVNERSCQRFIRHAMSNLFGCGKNVVLVTSHFST